MSLFGDINKDEYQEQIDKKVLKIENLFKDCFTTPKPSIFYSNPINYRMRAEFNIYHDVSKIKYFMINKIGKNKTKVFIDHFDPGSTLINFFMPIVAELISNNEIIRSKLFAIDFLTTLSGEALITLTYHKKLDDEWTNEANKLLEQLRNYKKSVNVIGRAFKQKISLNQDFVWEQLSVNNKTYRYQQVENSFTQPNANVCEKMLSWVKNNVIDKTSDLLELYCGNGNFSIALADNFRKVLATEISKTSVLSAQNNIKSNNINNIKIIRMSAEEFTQALNRERTFNRLRQAEVDLDDYNCKTILVDPPRSGLDIKTIELLQKYEKIIYISCNHDTLIENLKLLTKTHDILNLSFFDQFPYTEHIETGIILGKKQQH